MGQSSRPLSEEQLDGILSPELDKMVTDGKAFALHLGFLKTCRSVIGSSEMSACQLNSVLVIL